MDVCKNGNNEIGRGRGGSRGGARGSNLSVYPSILHILLCSFASLSSTNGWYAQAEVLQADEEVEHHDMGLN
jgi:hypothetical protein